MVASERVRLLNDARIRPGAKYVLYWAQINRRLDFNHALEYAAEIANDLKLPVLVYEGLTNQHPFASKRFHQFVLDGVPDNKVRAAELGLGYIFYSHARHENPNDVLYRLAAHAAVVITDDFPGYLAAAHNATVPTKIRIPYYVIDASCIVPMAAIGKQEYAAYTIRPKIHRLLDEHLHAVEHVRVKQKWVGPFPEIPGSSSNPYIDPSVLPSAKFPGGRRAALARLNYFLEHGLARYAKYNREPSADATSHLSPYLHFGHISALEIALAVRAYAAEHKLIVPEFLEELIVRRELAFNFARYGPDPNTLAALPDWAQQTLAKHDQDAREWVYSREQFERAETHDALWNATQSELLCDGVIHGYHRMYWGKKIIEWSGSHQEALDTMIYLHNRYALDGRDPNTYANILWCFGLHDRPWSERPIFGMIRYMNLAGMERKTDVPAYIAVQAGKK
jgi:deoxyribodipyrimidine photo-lyase